MEATRRAAPQLRAAFGVYGLTRQAFADKIPGQPEAAWIGNLGNTGFATVKNA